jgi:hypothetical protein
MAGGSGSTGGVRLAFWRWVHRRGWHQHGHLTDTTAPIRDILGLFDPNRHQPPEVHAKWVDDIGRNARCPCGSGKKFKKCHGSSHWRSLLLEAEQQFRRRRDHNGPG